MFSLDLAVNAVVAGLLLGGFYAAVTIGVTISFGMLDIVNIAHPAFIMLGSFVAYIVNSNFGIDPILIGVVMAPAFFLVGMAVYQIYYYAFEQRGEDSIQGLAFFFGLLFVAEVSLILVFGVDYRFVEAPYIGPSLHLGFVDLALRMLIPCLVSLLMLAVLQLFLGRTFIGRAILAVSQDRLALQLMAANPGRVKRIAFGISIATASVAGALLIIIQPVEPSIGRDYIGRIFAICVLGVMAAVTMRGEIIAGVIHDPVCRDWAYAVRGGGAWAEQEDATRIALRVADPVPVSKMEGFIGTTYLPEPLCTTVNTNLSRLATTASLRCAAHEYRVAAAGHCHLLFYNRLMPWDHAAGWLLHHEAGGYSAHFDGATYHPTHFSGGLIYAPDEASWHLARAALLGQ